MGEGTAGKDQGHPAGVIELRWVSLLPPERPGFEEVTGRVGIEGLQAGDSS